MAAPEWKGDPPAEAIIGLALLVDEESDLLEEFLSIAFGLGIAIEVLPGGGAVADLEFVDQACGEVALLEISLRVGALGQLLLVVGRGDL